MNGGGAGGFSQLTIFSTKVNYLFLFFLLEEWDGLKIICRGISSFPCILIGYWPKEGR